MDVSRRKKKISTSNSTPSVASEPPRVKVTYHPDVHVELDALPDKHAGQVLRKILSLSENPYPSDRRPMTDVPGVFRIDSGEYRIGFTEIKTATQHTINVVLVDRRNDKTFYKRIKRRLGL